MVDRRTSERSSRARGRLDADRPVGAIGTECVRIVPASPPSLWHGIGGTCDIRIGRYCYWRGDEEDDKPPPPEAPDVRDRRTALIRTLDSASRTIAGDAWIAGQHVRYLVEAGRIDDAWTFSTRECGATASWCNALAGYAAHSGQRFVAADSMYGVALAAMEPAERCRWLDASMLFDDELQHRFDRLDCAAREDFVRRVFWYGAPLYSVSATDLLTEHLARVTRAKIAEHSASIDGEALGRRPTRADDSIWLAAVVLASRDRRSDHSAVRASPVTTRECHTTTSRRFARSTTSAKPVPDDWHLDDSRAQTGYAPGFARSMHDLPNQVARFRRGDSTLVVATWDARRDTTLLGRSLDAALVVARPSESGAITRQSGAAAVGHIAVTALVDSGVVSLELLAKADRRAARARVGIAARTPGRVALSDLLLYSSMSSAPTELDAVRDSALASSVVPPSRSIGVFWESYGLQAAGRAGSLHAHCRGDRGRFAAARRGTPSIRRSHVGAPHSVG